jgi:hypothetical protein
MFRNLWGGDALSKRLIPRQMEQQGSTFDQKLDIHQSNALTYGVVLSA